MIDVAFTRADLRAADVAVVVDVLRATSTTTQALAAGYRSVLFVEQLEQAYALRSAGRVLAGERHGLTPPGFDQGNSPQDAGPPGRGAGARDDERRPDDRRRSAQRPGRAACLPAQPRGGAPPTGGRRRADRVLGDRGATALEDVYAAGRMCARLSGPHTDAARVAECVARSYATPFAALAASADAAVLRAAGLGDDVEFCARESTLDIVGLVAGGAPGIASVVDPDAT